MGKFPSIREIIELIKLLRIDVFFFLSAFTMSLPNVTSNQLVQDKYCLNKYNLPKEICLNLEQFGPELEISKNQILKASILLRNFQIIITTAPGIIFCLFFGYWIDSYPGHLRYLLAVYPLASMINMAILIYQSINFNTGKAIMEIKSSDLEKVDLMNTMLINLNFHLNSIPEPVKILYGSILPALTGGLAVVMAGSYTYITRKTPAKYRSVRFAILELFFFCCESIEIPESQIQIVMFCACSLAVPIGTSIGGKLLTIKPWFANQHRNYIGVFLTSAIVSLFASIWVLIFLDDCQTEDPRRNFEGANTSQGEKVTKGLGSVVREDSDSQSSDSTEIKVKSLRKTPKEVFMDIINTRNIVNMIRTCCRKRKNQGRSRLWNLILAMAAVLLCYMGDPAIGFQFSQKVYHWNAEYYSYISSIVTLVPSLGTIVLPALLIHKFHWHDTTVGLIGCTSLIAGMIIKGSLLTPLGYFSSVLIGMFAGLVPIAIRSLISRIIRFDEIGQVFALLSCIESSVPMVSSLFYTSIFNATLNFNSGTVFLVAGLLLLYPLGVLLWIHVTRSIWDSTLRPELEGTDRENMKENDSKACSNSLTRNINESK